MPSILVQTSLPPWEEARSHCPWRCQQSQYSYAAIWCRIWGNQGLRHHLCQRCLLGYQCGGLPWQCSLLCPWSKLPTRQTTKVDVYSFGVLLIEKIFYEPPKTTHEDRVKQFRKVGWDALADIIVRCTDPSPDERPSLARAMEKLTPFNVDIWELSSNFF